MIKIGDYVTRKKYQNDTLFKVLNIQNDIVYLKGVEFRLFADANINDLELSSLEQFQDDFKPPFIDDELERTDRYFYLMPVILQLDSDSDYIKRCMKYYKENNLYAIGKKIREEDMANELKELLPKIKPDILIITGHDAYYQKKGDQNDINNYMNSYNFSKAIKVARKYEKAHDKLIVIAGACQSDYEELIKSGADFASSPKRVNIHALDPAIIASIIAKTPRSKELDLLDMLKKTRNGTSGMGGIISNGMMYVGYPR